jgi:hypothetical protein
LFGRKCEQRNQCYQYLHEDFRHCCRRGDPGINIQAIKNIPDALEQFDESVEACANVFDRLERLGVTSAEMYELRKAQTASRTAMPANIALAGGNGYDESAEGVERGILVNVFRRTRPIASPRTMLVESAYRIETADLSGLIILLSFPWNSLKTCACS